MLRTTLLLLIASLIFTSNAGAAMTLIEDDDPRAQLAGGAFSKGSWSVQVSGAFMDDFGEEDVQIAAGTAELSYYLFDGFSFGLEVGGQRVSQEGDNDPFAYTAGVMLRHHIYTWNDEHNSLFLDVGCSFFQADSPVPTDGTTFNFLTRGGVGMTFETAPNVRILTAARAMHLSNASREGKDMNPSIDVALELCVGIMFTF